MATNSSPTFRRSHRSAVPALVLACGAIAAGHHARAQDLPPITPPGEARNDFESDDQFVTLDAFSEGVELNALIEYLVNALEINVSVDPSLSGTVMLNAPLRVHKDDLLGLVNSLLEQHGFGMTRTPSGFYNVLRIENLPSTLADSAGTLATTRIIPTPNIVPSILKDTIEAAMRGRGTTGSGGGVRVTYLDDLGVIVATDTPGNIRAIENLVAEIARERAKVAFTRLELRHLSAPVARERAIALVGQETSTGGPRQFVDPNNPQGATRFLDNLSSRLSVDPLGNALIFRGRPDEVEQIRSLLNVIDATSTLAAKRYFTGSATNQIADFAKQRGLGEVTKIQTGPTDPFQNQMQFQIDPNTGQLLQNSRTVGGTVIVADEYRGQIVYFATPEQQAQLEQLIKQFDTEGERIVIREYKLHHANAETVAEILLGLLQSSTPAADSPLLNTGTGQFRQNQNNRNRNFQRPESQGSEGEGTSLDSDNAFVIADIDNNQVLVKAPFAQQSDFAKIISKLDLRRPQVYIEAKIVSLTTSDSLRLAFETQLINANGTGGVVNTNFGLSTFPTGSGLNDPKTVSTALGGLTAAIIKSDQVPIIITALQNVAETRILSNPQLLVNDNEEAEIASIRQEPTTTTSLGGGGTGSRDVTSFGGYEDAGTTLTVTPRISEGGYLRLEYAVQLSAFDGTGSDGIPPPRIENNVRSSASLPTDFTIVVGGIEVDTKRKTVVKVPLLGDIPLFGHLFRDTNKNNASTRLYVFITPRIMRDETFADLRLLTRGPYEVSELEEELPDFEPSVIPLIDPRPAATTSGTPIGSR
ncbi:MAG: hypothetical protein KF902_02265 [Phycisphaeraceae bacterium]|nr:hypothetical protein [Phycisphaeraceae bacterium]